MEIEGVEEWEIEKILNKRKIRGVDKYLVRWKGFMAEHDTWERKEDLECKGSVGGIQRKGECRSKEAREDRYGRRERL